MARKKSAGRSKARAGKRTVRKKTPSRKTSSKKPAKKTARKKVRKKAVRRKATRKQAVRKPAAQPKRATAKPAAPRAAAPRALAAPSSAAATPPRPVAPAGAPASVAGKVPERVGIVTHYFAHVNAGVIALEQGELRVGDTVQFRGHTTDFYQRLEHMEVDHRPIDVARAGQSVGVQVAQRVREHDQVFRVSR